MIKCAKVLVSAIMAGLTAAGAASMGEACTSLIVGKDASTTGHAFFGRSSDYVSWNTVNIQVFPQGSFKRGQEMVDPYEKKCYGNEGIYQYTFSHDSYKFLASPYAANSFRMLPVDARVYYAAGVNEKGVAVSATNTTELRKEAEVAGNAYAKQGIAESFAAMVLLAESDNARDGVRRMGELVERDGVGNQEGFLLMIGDNQEVWVFETLGRHRWVASRVPDDKILVVANDPVTDYVNLNDTANFMGTPDIQEFAIRHGFAIYGPKGSGHEKEVNLAASYGDLHDFVMSTYRRWRGYQLFAPSLGITAVKHRQSDTYPMYVKPDHKISPVDEMKFHRDRYQGTPYDCSLAKQVRLNLCGYETEDPYNERKYRVRPMGVEYMGTVHILELNGYPPAIGGRVWYCLGAAEDSVFLPYYGNVTDTHPWCKSYVDGNLKKVGNEMKARTRYQPDSAASVFCSLGNIARRNRKLYGQVVKAYWESQEERLMAEQPAIEQQLLALYRRDPSQSAQFATAYSMQTEQWAVNRAALMRKELLQHIATAPKTTFVLPPEGQPYVNLEPRTDMREDLNEPLVVERALGLGEHNARMDQAPVVDYARPATVPKFMDARALADSVTSLNMKFGPKANFSRLQYTIELMGKDYAAFGNRPERVRQELRLFLGGKEVIGPNGVVSLPEAIQKRTVQFFGDEQRMTVVVDFCTVDQEGAPLWQSGLLIVPDGQQDKKIELTAYAAGAK